MESRKVWTEIRLFPRGIDMSKKSKINSKNRILIGAAAMAILVAGSMLSVYGISKAFSRFDLPKAEAAENSQNGTDANGSPASQGNTASFTFTGVGDNLLHDPIFYYFEEDHGNRDYLPIYANTLEMQQAADLSYINFETICAGDDFGLSGYPDFNGPVEMIDTLSQTGVNWISTASNHSLDRGPEGLLFEMSYINDHYPQITYTGTYMNEEAYNTPMVKEINGIKVGMATFTYGLNGRVLPEGYEWLIDVYADNDGTVDYDRMKTVLDRLNEVSDVQIVTMHWGEEYQNTPNDQQKAVAQFLHENGVEAVIGTHPHVIQPAEMMVSEDQTTLVYYSLGNFLSAQNQNITMVGGMADFTLNYDFDTRKASFSDVEFIPTVTWISPDLRQYETHTLPQWTDEMGQNHYIYQGEGQDMSVQWIRDYVASVMGTPENIKIVYE